MKDELKKPYDFGCWAIKYDRSTANGYTYQNGCLKNNDGSIVPLLWNHNHNDPTQVLGHVLLESRDEGIYIYGKLHDNLTIVETVKQLLYDRESIWVSPYINKIKTDGKVVTDGAIREISIVIARVDPDDAYVPELWEVKYEG